MVLAPFNPSNKYFHHEIIYEDTAINLGIIDKIENSSWFVKYRAHLKDGSSIVYYGVNYKNGLYPWGKESFHNIIKGFVKEAKNNILFTYNPNDFQKAINQMKQYIEDNEENLIYAMEVTTSSYEYRNYPGFDINTMFENQKKNFQLEKDIYQTTINML